jgi:hypothetical protein
MFQIVAVRHQIVVLTLVRSLMELTAALALSSPFIKLTRLIYREPVLPTGPISVQPSGRSFVCCMSTISRLSTQFNYFGLYIPIIAEFGGQSAVSLLRKLEKAVQRYGPRWTLWTRLHIARKKTFPKP